MSACVSEMCACSDHVQWLKQQVLVMRKELKNLRQYVESSVRAHRKHMMSLHSTLKDVLDNKMAKTSSSSSSSKSAAWMELSLEKGNIRTIPIGFITSCFAQKNGTPRQPAVCSLSRARLQLQSSVFNNPEHALTGLQHYSHVWLIFLFHKNGHMSHKAKVKPPRLNGEKVGVYSTRSPHRPNAIGLTLAKLDSINGDVLQLSGVDLISGTPVLDIKPYIPEYDSPHGHATLTSERQHLYMEVHAHTHDTPEEAEPTEPERMENPDVSCSVLEAEEHHGDEGRGDRDKGCTDGDDGHGDGDEGCSDGEDGRADGEDGRADGEDGRADGKDGRADGEDGRADGDERCGDEGRGVSAVLQGIRHFLLQGAEDKQTHAAAQEEDEDEDGGEVCKWNSRVASWVRNPPIHALSVRFTPTAESQLSDFLPPHCSDAGKPKFQFFQSPEEAAAAIRGVLSADPRSVYRRNNCSDRLFFFTLDTAHITCWFGDGFAEVLQVQPTMNPD